MSEIKTIVTTPGAGISRREFTLETCLAILAGATITIMGSGCGSSGSSPAGPSGGSSGGPGAGSGDKSGAISSNHGHTATITAAELTAGNALNVLLTAGSGHTHQVALTANDVAMVAANQRVSRESTVNNGHSHTVTFN
jgi:hypothetical protein